VLLLREIVAFPGVPYLAHARSPHQLGGFQLSLAKLVPVNACGGIPPRRRVFSMHWSFGGLNKLSQFFSKIHIKIAFSICGK